MITFVIPAHNEEAWVGRCIIAIRNAMEAVDTAHEIIVVDDSSTDETSSIAREHGACVLRVEHRHIAATRNAGASGARGDELFFIDADTLVTAGVIRSALRSLSEGAVGGGCVPRFEGWLPVWWRMVYPFFVLGARVFRQPGGSCLFCTRSAFEATGGFSEIHFAAEDALFASALKRHGRFVVIAETVVTSGRNLRAHSFWSIARLLTRLALRGPGGFRDREGLDLWYRPSREKTR
ncbi:MAG: glycosyltransferase [Luteolibacter sp.]|uniref:glycosyltransferase n=1 Tax=Luteolibacter sp. TaxID=1962973 RepID=UPI0032650FEC